MSTPEDIREQLSAYLDGELGEAEARRVEDAVRAEPALEKELERLRTTRQLVHALPHAPAPDGFAGRVISYAERRRLMNQLPGTRPYRSFRWITLAAAAVVLLAAGMGMFLLVTSHGPRPDRTADAGGTPSTQPTGALALGGEKAGGDFGSVPGGDDGKIDLVGKRFEHLPSDHGMAPGPAVTGGAAPRRLRGLPLPRAG